MENYRDFVGIGEELMSENYGTRAYVDTVRNTLVYTATHKGENYLPFMNRSFISFSFGGKNIEDYNLIAVTENNRLNRSGSSDFEDLVDAYNILDGLFYWGTHFKPNKISLKLATDGITLNQLDDFKYWFAGGKTRELILAEHPNRAILARVESPPNLLLLPFELPTTVLVGGITYNTSTTLYKGEITLNFIMDLPFWYSKINIFGHMDEDGIYHDQWTDANGNTVNIYDTYKNIDIMKIVLEDNIPTSIMIANSMLLGNNVFANIDNASGGHIAKYTVYASITKIIYPPVKNDLGLIVGEETYELLVTIGYLFNDIPSELNVYILNNQLYDLGDEDKPVLVDFLNKYNMNASTSNTVEELHMKVDNLLNENGVNLMTYSKLDDDPNALIYDPETLIGAHIAGPHMANNTGVEFLAANDSTYFYYAGTAYALPEISFGIQPTINGYGFINTPANSYAPSRLNLTYEYISITSLNTKEFRFTTPNIFTSYNEVIKIFRTLSSKVGDSWEEIRILIRDNVKHHAVRAWAMKVIDFYVKKYDSKIINNQNAILLMQLFLYDEHENIPIAYFVFNSENGKSLGTFKYRIMTNTNFNFNAATETSLFLYATNSLVTQLEDVGDMVKSDYLIIKDRNHPDETGHIVAWTNTNDFTKTYSHKIEHSLSNGIHNLFVKYKNMYL